MRQAIRDPAELCRALQLPETLATQAVEANDDFKLFAPREYVARMQPGNAQDPLLLQVLPRQEETISAPGFDHDPVADAAASVTPNLLHKYSGRALMVTTGACAIHCRYCFRRHFPYDQSPPQKEAWRAALQSVAADDSIEEVILSGGDPLTLTDDQLAWLIERIASIGHVVRLRIHTRLPIVIPNRVTDSFCELLTSTRLAPIVVVHANHAQELDFTTITALQKIAGAGVMLFNQAVLLRNVNDSSAAQIELCRRLIEARTTPYYLHELDRVVGASHFEASRQTALEIMNDLRENLPGYAIPRLVREQPGEKSKSWIG